MYNAKTLRESECIDVSIVLGTVKQNSDQELCLVLLKIRMNSLKVISANKAALFFGGYRA